MKKLCFIGGVSRAGKSTLIDRISSQDGYFTFKKFHHVLAKSFKESGINLEDSLNHWSQVMPLAVKKYLDSLPETGHTLSDIHYAVQPNYDLAAHMRDASQQEKLYTEPYVWGVDHLLIEALVKEGVQISTILLYAPINEITERRTNQLKYNGFTRSLDQEHIRVEAMHEIRFFEEISNGLNIADIGRLKLDNSEINFVTNYAKVINFLKASDSNLTC